MIRLSDILRKEREKKAAEETIKISPLFKPERKEEGLKKIQTTYEAAILNVKRLMSDIMKVKILEDREFFHTAENIVYDAQREKDVLLSLVNDFSLEIKKENYLYEHSVNTSILATNVGLAMRYNRGEVVDLCASSLLHDIGMLKIPEEISKKPSKLTKEEFDIIKKHPHYGLELLKRIKDPPQSAAEVIYQHHEKIDGSGYPEGKKGDEISDYAKIVGIVEAYEARTHPRPYHRILPYEGVKMIVQASRTAFDPELVKAFLKNVTPYPPGSFVLLNNDEIGRVIAVNEDLPMRPVVEVVLDADKNFLEKPIKINLADSPVLSIKTALSEPAL